VGVDSEDSYSEESYSEELGSEGSGSEELYSEIGPVGGSVEIKNWDISVWANGAMQYGRNVQVQIHDKLKKKNKGVYVYISTAPLRVDEPTFFTLLPTLT